MPAIVVDDITVLPRIPAPDPAIARERRVRSVTVAPQGFEGEGFPVRRAFAGVDARGPRPVRPPRPDGRGRVRPRRAQGHAVAPASRLRDRHLHDRRDLRAQRLERRRRGHHQRRHPVDDRGRRDPPHREAAGAPRRAAAGCSTASSSGSTCRPTRSGPRRATRTSARTRSALLSSRGRRRAVRVIAGEVAGHAGPGSTYSPMTLVHATLSPGARLDLPWRADYNALVYVMNGDGTVGSEGRPIGMGQLAVLGPGDALTVAAGRSTGEPQPDPGRARARRPADPRARRVDGPVRDEHPRGGPAGGRRLPGRAPRQHPGGPQHAHDADLHRGERRLTDPRAARPAWVGWSGRVRRCPIRRRQAPVPVGRRGRIARPTSREANVSRAATPLSVILGLFIASLAMRPQILAIGPLLPFIRDDLGLSAVVAGLLTTIPVLCMGVFAPAGPRLAARLGPASAFAACLVAIVGFGAIRALAPGAPLVLATTLGIGIGIGTAGRDPLDDRVVAPARPSGPRHRRVCGRDRRRLDACGGACRATRHRRRLAARAADHLARLDRVDRRLADARGHRWPSGERGHRPAPVAVAQRARRGCS